LLEDWGDKAADLDIQYLLLERLSERRAFQRDRRVLQSCNSHVGFYPKDRQNVW